MERLADEVVHAGFHAVFAIISHHAGGHRYDGKVGKIWVGPDDLVAQARGHVFQMNVSNREFEDVKEKYNVISTIPSINGWDVQVVAENTGHYPSVPIEPNLEHAYVYFMELVLNQPQELY